MNHQSNITKVASDMYFSQFGWAFWYLGIQLFVHIFRIIFNDNKDIQNYFQISFFTSNMFMFVIGIVAATYFLSHYVKNGVTRGHFVQGGLLAAFGLAITIPIIAAIVSSIVQLVIKLFKLPIQFTSPDQKGDMGDENFIGDIVWAIVNPHYLEENHLMILVIISIANLFFYYMMGWLIGSGFNRHFLFGMLMIVVAVSLFTIKAYVWGDEEQILTKWFSLSTMDLPIIVSILFMFIMIGITYFFIRRISRRVTVKL